MRWLIAAFLAVIAYSSPVEAFWHSVGAGQNSTVTAPPYVGPGDVVVFTAWYSCAFGYNTAYATPGTNLACDVVDSATGAASCTLHVQTNGSVNQNECDATACATACKISRAYDQTGNGHHVVQATLANMPNFAKNATTGHPAFYTGNVTSTLVNLLCSTCITSTAQPVSMVGVAMRAGQPLLQADIMRTLTAGTGNGIALRFYPNNNTIAGIAPSTLAQGNNAPDSQWHTASFVANGTTSVIEQDPFSTTGDAGTAVSSTSISVGNWQSQSQNYYIGEDGFALGVNFDAGTRFALCRNEQIRWGTSNFPSPFNC